MTATRKADKTKVNVVIAYNLYRHKRYLVDGMSLTRKEFNKLYETN